MDYKPQVTNEHYFSNSYESRTRFISYFNQKESVIRLIANVQKDHVLEIGKGSGFLTDYLKKLGVNVKTFDIANDLNPDYLGDLTKIDEVVKEKFEIICCFEVLEHIKYEEIEGILEKFKNITSKYLVISLPQSRAYFSFWIRMNILQVLSGYVSIPLFLKHKFDGEHYWELGRKGYSLINFRKLLKINFNIEDEYTDPLDTYHRFFILKNNKLNV